MDRQFDSPDLAGQKKGLTKIIGKSGFEVVCNVAFTLSFGIAKNSFGIANGRDSQWRPLITKTYFFINIHWCPVSV